MLRTDVAVESDCRQLIEWTVARFGRLDTLVNNAGATMWARVDEIRDLGMLDRIMRVNYMGSVYCTAHALPHLKASRGRIVGIASTTVDGVPALLVYLAKDGATQVVVVTGCGGEAPSARASAPVSR